MSLHRTIANNLWHLSCVPERRAFVKALKNVSHVQEQVLLKLINRNRRTLFGQQHRFKSISSVEQYQAEVPLGGYEDYRPYIDKIRNGESNVLSADEVMQLHLSSGTSSASKLLPFTPSLQREFERGLSLWLLDCVAVICIHTLKTSLAPKSGSCLAPRAIKNL